jgi:hypothetical protein
MWPSRNAQRQQLIHQLQTAKTSLNLHGLPDVATVETLALQLVASLRREDFYQHIQAKTISPRRADPNGPSFDAERAVAFHMQQRNADEAGWLLFLMTHFARRPDSGWRRLQDVYGRRGMGLWSWAQVAADPVAFFRWLEDNWRCIGGSFGNHRKYESLRPDAKRPMSRVVADYLALIGPSGHTAFFARALRSAGNHPHTVFDHLYRNMNVMSFGRLAKFDYLSLVGRYGLAPIEAGSAYLEGATGPARGARLLVSGSASSSISNGDLQDLLDSVDHHLQVGMTVMEDALCNWQKSPRSFIHYVG